MKKYEWIIKRDGSLVRFKENKIQNALYKAGKSTGEFDESQSIVLSSKVIKILEELDIKDINIENVQDIVEQVLMDSEYKKTAKAYILYREQHAQNRKRDIFKPRFNLKPYEYPQLLEYVDSIRHSYWIHTEFNYTSDIQDFKINVSQNERDVIRKAMLAIAQIEVSVKTFWGDIFKHIPKPEIGSVGYTFAESEVRHHDAYSNLLEILGLNQEFEHIHEIPVIMKRINYLDKTNAIAKSQDNKGYTLAILLFSLFVEHVSLFSQFLIIMSFNKYKNLFKGISNAIEATSKEEQVHGLFGIELIGIIREEHPEWFDQEMSNIIKTACMDSLEAEEEIVDWIYESGDLDFIPKDIVKEFIKNRLNNSLKSIGEEPLFEVDQEMIDKTEWFDIEVITTKHTDFFVKRSINYNKRSKSITSEDLF